MGQAELNKRRRGVTLGMHRLVIIEWLRKDEYRTGTELKHELLAIEPDLPVEHIECWSSADVLKAVDDLAVDTQRSGRVPILQIEAHGYDEGGECGLCGPGPNGEEDLSWDALGGSLRALNIATRFNLIFIGAACVSDNAVETVKRQPGLPLPFVIAVGFVKTVRSDRLLDAMVSLHQELLLNKLTLQEALELAHAKLKTTIEAMAWFFLPTIIRNAALDAARTGQHDALAQKHYPLMLAVRGVAGVKPDSPEEYRRKHLTHVPGAIEKVVGALLAYDVLPENRKRFGFDGKKLAREAQRTRPLVRPKPSMA